jgi:hypothetical protein
MRAVAIIFFFFIGAFAFSRSPCHWSIIPSPYEPFDNTTLDYIQSNSIKYIETINDDTSQYYLNSHGLLDSSIHRHYDLDENESLILYGISKHRIEYDSLGRITSQIWTEIYKNHKKYTTNITKELTTYLEGKIIEKSKDFSYYGDKREYKYSRSKRWRLNNQGQWTSQNRRFPYRKSRRKEQSNGDYLYVYKREIRSLTTDTIKDQIIKKYLKKDKKYDRQDLVEYEIFNLKGDMLFTYAGEDSNRKPIIAKEYRYDSNDNLQSIKINGYFCERPRTIYFHRSIIDQKKLEYEVTSFEEYNNSYSIDSAYSDTTFYKYFSEIPN